MREDRIGHPPSKDAQAAACTRRLPTRETKRRPSHEDHRHRLHCRPPEDRLATPGLV